MHIDYYNIDILDLSFFVFHKVTCNTVVSTFQRQSDQKI